MFSHLPVAVCILADSFASIFEVLRCPILRFLPPHCHDDAIEGISIENVHERNVKLAFVINLNVTVLFCHFNSPGCQIGNQNTTRCSRGVEQTDSYSKSFSLQRTILDLTMVHVVHRTYGTQTVFAKWHWPVLCARRVYLSPLAPCAANATLLYLKRHIGISYFLLISVFYLLHQVKSSSNLFDNDKCCIPMCLGTCTRTFTCVCGALVAGTCVCLWCVFPCVCSPQWQLIPHARV